MCVNLHLWLAKPPDYFGIISVAKPISRTYLKDNCLSELSQNCLSTTLLQIVCESDVIFKSMPGANDTC